MANKFDIDSSADTHLLNETFHVFSKSPGSPTTTLGGARLKSGHTTTATDVWADEIPAFFNAATQAKFDLFQSKAVKDDLCLFDGKVYQHNGTAFVSLGTTDEVLVDGKTFSKNNKAVVKYHKGRTAINLTADNNNGDGSNNYTAKIYNAATGSTTFVPQFISAMDKMVDGIPSLAYDAVVSDSTGVLAEGLTADNDYICNSYAGVIQFNKARSQGTVTVSAWEYIGEKLTASLTELSKKVESVTATAGEGVQAVTDAATTAGLFVSTKTITPEGQTDPVEVKALDINVAEVSAQGVVTTGDGTKLVTATGAQNIAGKVVSDAIGGLDSSIIESDENGYIRIDIQNGKLTGGYVKIAAVSDQGEIINGENYFVRAGDAVKIATKVASDEIAASTLAAGQEIATTEDTTKLVTVEDVTTYVSPLEQKVNDHLLDAAGKLEISVLADKLPKKPFFEDEVAYVNSYGFEWEKLSNNIYTNKFEVKVAQSVNGLNEFKSHTTGTVLTPSSLAAQTCKLVIYSIDDAEQLTEVAVSQPNTFDASTSIYAFKFDNQISLTSGVRYRICFRTVDGTNALHCLPVIVNSSIENADVTKHETPTRYIIGETEDDWWGCWNTVAGQLNGVDQVVYGPKVSVSGLTPATNEDGSTLIGEKGKIYLIPNEGTENQNVYDEFVWTNNTWEKIGTTKVDLSEYVKTTDLAGYVKTIKVNGRSEAVTTDTTEIDLGSVVTGFYASSASGGNGSVPNSASIRVWHSSGSQENGIYDIGVIDATETDKGLVTICSTVDSYNTTGTVTGAAVASAISTAVGEIDLGVTGITVKGGSKQTGDVTLNVVTGFRNSTETNANVLSVDSDAIHVNEYSDGTYIFYAVVADATHAGVTYLYDKTATGLGSSKTATVSEATVKSVYNTLSSKIPTLYVSSINNRTGYITLEAGGNWNNSTVLNKDNSSQTNLWGLNVDVIENKQVVIDGFIGDESVYGKIGSFYNRVAGLPAEATKVIGNFVYGSDGKVIDTIRAERMVSGLFGRNATGLTEWVADMPNLKNGNQCFRELNNLTTFCGDLSSLTNGSLMFYETIALTSFIGDLSSLENGEMMFSSGPYSITQSSKLNSESVECILESIPDWTGDDEEHKLDIGVSTIITDESDVRQSIKDITGVELTATVGNTQEITYKGWTITFVVTE